MADRKAEQGAVQYGQDRWSFENEDSRLAGAGHIANEIRRLVEQGQYTDYVSGLSVKGRLINRMIDVVYWPRKLFANNEVGTWYDPSDVSLNWRRNLLTYTEQFDNAAWSKFVTSATSITANSIVAPDGNTTADTMTRGNTTTSEGGVRFTTTQSISTTYTLSVYGKVGTTGNLLYLRNLAIDNTTTTGLVKFNLTNGTIDLTLGSTYTGKASITIDKNGYYRCSITGTTASSIANNLIDIGLTSSGTVGGTAGDYLYIWGAQLEVGTSPTSYQSIVTPEITYVADVQPQPILYQDQAGTTPVTAVEQPVSLMLDKSKGLVIGGELVTNGDFSNGTTGWSVFTGVTISGGTANFNTTSNDPLISSSIAITAGKVYIVEFDIVSYTRGTLTLLLGTTTSVTVPSPSVLGRKKLFVTAGTSTPNVRFQGGFGSGIELSLDNISVKEIAGNHAYTPSTASTSRPTLSARYNLLTYSDNFSASWGTTRASYSNGVLTSALSTGTNTSLIGLGITTTVSTQYTASIRAKPNTLSWVRLSIANLGALDIGGYFNLANGTTGSIGANTTSSSITGPDSDGYYRCSITFTSDASDTSGNFNILLAVANNNVSVSQDGAQSIYVDKADLRVSNDGVGLPDYQRIAAATDYDTVNFPPYLRFDGSDDYMLTNSIDFTGTDKMTVFAGVRKLSDAAGFGLVAETSVNTGFANPGSFGLFAPATGGTATYHTAVGRTVTSSLNMSTYTAPITNVINVSFNNAGATRADAIIPRVNGITPTISDGADVPPGSGNFGNYPLYIGRRGGTTLPFNGRLGQLIIRGAASTASEITNTEQWINSKIKAY